jgi:hypothetical protein
MQSTHERKPCGTCGKECSVNADGTVRHHLTDNPEFRAGPDSRKCKGAGQPPATAAGVALAEDMEDEQPQCRLCKHPVQLTSNGRVRSHLTPEATPRPCPGGSDFPLGTYPDMVGTTDGLVASLAFDCEHREIGACHDCHAARSGAPDDISQGRPADADHDHVPGTDDYGATACIVCGLVLAERPTAPWGVDPGAAQQPTMADQFKASPLAAVLERETAGAGTVLDAMDGDTRSEAERFAGAAVPTQPTAQATCTHDRYENFGPKAGVRCVSCNAKHPDPHAYEAAVAIATVEAEKAQRQAAALPVGETEDGRPCDHSDGLFGMEDGKTVCVACGTPCTHPDGFTENDPAEDDGEGLIYTCAICGSVEPSGPDPELPNCPHPETHRAGCGCPDDDDSAGQFGPDEDPQVRLGELDEGDYFLRQGTLMRLAERESSSSVLAEVMDGPHKGRTGELKNLNEVVQRAPAPEDGGKHAVADDSDDPEHADDCPGCPNDTGPVLLGDLEVGEHFVRRGTVMRVTDTLSGDVHAVVVEGPHKGREGVLPNNHETVERTHCRHRFTWADDGHWGHSGTFCDYCGKEQETKECTDDRKPQQRPASSAESTPATTSPTTAPGSPQRTKGSAPAVSPKSQSVTPSAPTARAAGNGGSAAVTNDQQAAAAAAFLGSGQPAAPVAAGPADQASAAAQFLAGAGGTRGEDETKRDRYGRYLIPHPDTGKEQAWTRATTFAKSISDTYALSQWGLRMALLGATQRPDIVRRAHGKHVKADKKLLDELTAELKDAAGAKVAANDGTAMHSFTELADRAWHSPGGPRSVLGQVPEDCREMVETYIRLLEETGLEPVSGLIEFTTVVKQYGVAGTSDNCYRVTRPLKLKIGRAEVHLSPGEYVIGDKKTGKDLDYGWQEIVIQLATYAQGLNTAGVWDRRNEVWIPDPLNGGKVRLDAGVVVHLPVDKESEKTPTVYGIDLESGWNAAVLCERVRAWRKVRTLASPVMVSEAETFAPSRPAAVVKAAPMAGDYDPDTGVTSRTTVRPPTLADRAQAVTSKTEASAVWTDARAAGLPDAEVDRLVAVMQSRLKKLAEPGG